MTATAGSPDRSRASVNSIRNLPVGRKFLSFDISEIEMREMKCLENGDNKVEISRPFVL